MHRHTKSVVAGAVALLTLTGVAGPAFAAGGTPGTPTIVPVVQPTAGHETVKPNAKDASKGRAAAEIARRQRTLSALSAKVARVTADCGENAALVAELAAESAGLAALGHTIANETDTSKLKAEYASIFRDYRVYLLETPKTHTVVACDRVTESSTKITAWIAKAQSAIDKAAAAGADVGAAQTALDAVKPALDAAVAAATSAATAVSPLVPDKGDKAVLASNNAAIKAAITGIRTARSNLAVALKDARKAMQALRGSKSSGSRPDRAARPRRGAATS